MNFRLDTVKIETALQSKNFLGQCFCININMQKMTNLRASENPQKRRKNPRDIT